MSISTTITVSREIKKFLELVKKTYEEKYKRKLKWDEFLELIAVKSMELGSHLELNEDEAKILMEMTIRGRESWRRSV